MPEVEEEDDEALVLRKLKPKIPDHNDAHPVAEDMHIRKDSGLRLWRQSGPICCQEENCSGLQVPHKGTTRFL